MGVQNFKGDATELKMQAVGNPLFDQTTTALGEFYLGAFESSPFILMLYDEQRMPFSERIPRAAFVAFIKEALKRFPVTGTFESYLFVLNSIFGSGDQSEITFSVPAPGMLEIDVMAIASSEFEATGREFVDGAYTSFNITDSDGNQLIFRGIPGIDTQYELDLLFSELIPAGIAPTITLEFFSRYDWIAEESGPTFYNMVDQDENKIIFYELGG